MDSLSKLSLGVSRINNTEHWDNDTKVNMNFSDVKHWCNEFLRLDKNIEETSISNQHKVERRERAIKEIFNL